MTEAQPANSGELSSFLHLTGWRPLLLALIAGLAGGYGLFLALDEPAQWQSRYVLNASRIADDDLSPQELDIFVEEIAQTARFPQVVNAVEERTGLVAEDDYQIMINQSAASAQFVDINVVSDDPVDSQTVAIETGIEALTITLTDILRGNQSAAEEIREVIAMDEAQINALTIEAGGFTPPVASQIAVDNVVQRRLDIANPPMEPCLLADGTQGLCEVEYSGPSLEELEAEAARLVPLERQYTTLDATIQAANLRLGDLNDSIRDSQAALRAAENERENQLILDEVITEETSRIAGLLTGLLLFAVPAALLLILLFTLYDLLRPKPALDSYAPAFDDAGELGTRGALPEAKITPLTVVDEDGEQFASTGSVDGDDDEYLEDEDGFDKHDFNEYDESEFDDDDDPTPPQRKKENRWGRDADPRAG